MRFVSILTVFLLCMNVSLAAEYFVDCSASSNGQGTYANPWNSVQAVNAHGLADGDDLYFLSGSVCTLTPGIGEKLVLTGVDGSPSNWVVIGCYWKDSGAPNLNCQGKPLPVLDGNNYDEPGVDVPDGRWEAIIFKQEQDTVAHVGYLRIQELEVRESQTAGISINGPSPFRLGKDHAVNGGKGECSHVVITKSHVWKNDRSNVIIARCHDSEISHNELSHSPDLREETSEGGSNYFTGVDPAGIGTSYHNYFAYNNVHDCYECLDLGHHDENSIIEYNTFYNLHDMAVYVQASKNATIRYNLIYEAANDVSGRDQNGIWIEDEGFNYQVCFAGGHKIYGNLIATGGYNINFNCHYCKVYNMTCWKEYKDIEVYNNILINGQENIFFGWSWAESPDIPDIKIKNNILLSQPAGKVYTSRTNALGVQWDRNLFFGKGQISGNPGNNALFSDPQLTKMTGWESIPAGLIDAEWFRPKAGSPAIDSGLALGAPFNIDYSQRTRQAPWDLGAFESASCIEQWTCSAWGAWSACVGSQSTRTRTCSDSNSCGTFAQRPALSEKKPCGNIPHSVTKINITVSLDGNLAEFSNAAPILLTEAHSGVQGRYYLMYDNAFLYVGADVTDTALNADQTTRDGLVWKDDAIELMFDVDNDRGTVDENDYKIFASIRNIQSDARGSGGNIDTSWNGEFESFARTTGTLNQAGDTDKGYTLELKIPFSTLGSFRPANKTLWGFELGLRDMDEGRISDYAMWSNSDGEETNNPDGWGTIIFNNLRCTRIDKDGDGIVSMQELTGAIFLWKSGSIGLTEIMNGIVEWRFGC